MTPYIESTPSQPFIHTIQTYISPLQFGLKVIEGIFPKKTVSVNYGTSAKGKSIEFQMKNQPRNDLQKKAISFIMKMKNDPDMRQRFLSLATGSGKTYITINCISQLKRKALIIVDTLELASQWKREFLNHTNLEESDIVILSGADSIEKELKDPKGKIYIAIHRTLGNMISQDINGINSLMNKLGIGVRVFDESHVEFGNICRVNSLSNVNYTIYLTATPSRSNFNDNSLYAKIFKPIPYFNGKEMTDEKYHTVVLYKMDTKPGVVEKASVKTKYGFAQAKWAQHCADGGYQEFLEAVGDIFRTMKLLERGKKTAIMLPTIDLIKKLKDDLLIMYPEIDLGCFIGEIPKGKRTEQLQKQFILTNDKIFDKGIDVPDLEILINFVPLGSLVKVEQIMGRLRQKENLSSILIDVTDTGFEECIRQSKVRKRFYKKKAKKIIEINK